MKRVAEIAYRSAWLIGGVLSFLLLVGLSYGTRLQDVDADGDGMAGSSDAGQDYAEVFSAGSNGIVYINWQEPQATNDFSRAAWFLGAYRFADGSFVIELDRGSSNGLTNNLRYAIHFEGRAGQPVPPSNSVEQPSLYLNLLGTNGVVLAASEDLLTSSNVDHYVFFAVDSEFSETNTVLLVNVPTAEYPDAAVIQLIAADDGTVPIIVGKSALYIDEDGDGWTATTEIRNETSDYIFDASGGVISNYSDWVNGGGGSTNNPPGGDGGTPPADGDGGGDQGGGNNGGTVYINQAIGDDSFTGYAPTVAGRNGPKKTIRKGLAAVEQDGAHTLIINSGHYGEDLDLRGKGGVKVIIAGNVRL